jgi:glycosyltransferase involved in cell wall biosynthesis
MSPKITFLIRDLGYGGAQRQLVNLAKGLSDLGWQVTVLFFYPGGAFVPDLQESAVTAICLEKSGRWDLWTFFWRVVNHLKSIEPDILHGYLGESNLLAIALKLFFPKMRVVWGIRNSNEEVPDDFLIHTIGFLTQNLARFTDLIIVNSHAAFSDYIIRGFPKQKMRVVPNGIDLKRFKCDRQSGAKVRSEWKIPDRTILIGLVGRIAPMKDHPTFLKAAELLYRERQDVQFICMGEGRHDYLQQLQQLTQELGIADRVIWSRGRTDMLAVYNAIDLVVSASAYGEGFSNVLGEAMACDVPCIATDVGDSAWILGEKGAIVPPKNSEALAAAMQQTIANLQLRDRPQHSIGMQVRERFSTTQLFQNTANLLTEILT